MTMKFTQLLSIDQILIGVNVSSKKRLMETLSEVLCCHLAREQNKPSYIESLCHREKIGSTAIGQGVAIPHIKVDDLEKPFATLLKLKNPIEYHAPDNKPVDLILALFIPEKFCSGYSFLLPDIAEKLHDKILLKKLRGAKSPQEVWNILVDVDKDSELLD